MFNRLLLRPSTKFRLFRLDRPHCHGGSKIDAFPSLPPPTSLVGDFCPECKSDDAGWFFLHFWPKHALTHQYTDKKDEQVQKETRQDDGWSSFERFSDVSTTAFSHRCRFAEMAHPGGHPLPSLPHLNTLPVWVHSDNQRGYLNWFISRNHLIQGHSDSHST